MMRRRVTALLAAAGVLAAGVLACWAHSLVGTPARDARDHAVRGFVGHTGMPDLALSSSSRWLRHMGLAEPAAACQDGPPCLDTDPAGLSFGPPWSIFRGRATASRP